MLLAAKRCIRELFSIVARGTAIEGWLGWADQHHPPATTLSPTHAASLGAVRFASARSPPPNMVWQVSTILTWRSARCNPCLHTYPFMTRSRDIFGVWPADELRPDS